MKHFLAAIFEEVDSDSNCDPIYSQEASNFHMNPNQQNSSIYNPYTNVTPPNFNSGIYPAQHSNNPFLSIPQQPMNFNTHPGMINPGMNPMLNGSFYPTQPFYPPNINMQQNQVNYGIPVQGSVQNQYYQQQTNNQQNVQRVEVQDFLKIGSYFNIIKLKYFIRLLTSNQWQIQ